jgi:hypothetical protein
MWGYLVFQLSPSICKSVTTWNAVGCHYDDASAACKSANISAFSGIFPSFSRFTARDYGTSAFLKGGLVPMGKERF